MKLEKEFDPVSEDVSLPDGLLDRLEKAWLGLKYVVVERKVGKAWKKINRIDFPRTPEGRPEGTAEEVATICVAIAMWHVEDCGDEGSYRARMSREVGGKETKPSCTWKQGFGDSAEGAMDASDPDTAAMVGMVLNASIQMINIQNGHIENQNIRILELSTASTKQIEQLLKTNETLVAQYHQGLAMQANSMSLLLDVERNLESDKQRGKNNEKLIDILKMAAPVAFQQFGNFMTARAGGTPSDVTVDVGEDDDGDASADEEEESAVDEQEADEQADLKKNMRERPITTFAHAFKDSLTNDQLIDMSTLLTKGQLSAFKQLSSCAEDPQTSEAILKFRTMLLKTPDKFASLAGILTDTQNQMILRLNQLAEETSGSADDN